MSFVIFSAILNHKKDSAGLASYGKDIYNASFCHWDLILQKQNWLSYDLES